MGSTPLQWAVFEGDIAAVKRLLAAGADPNAMNAYGVDAIQLAADESNTELLRLLLNAGANPNSANPDGETVLHLVARSGNLDAARLLVNAGAQVEARERFGGQTPLMWATARRHPALRAVPRLERSERKCAVSRARLPTRRHGREPRQAPRPGRLHTTDVRGARELPRVRADSAQARRRCDPA